MIPKNSVFRPEVGSYFTLDDIPEWDARQLGPLAERGFNIVNVRHPVGGDPTFVTVTNDNVCLPGECAYLNIEERSAMWGTYGNGYDGVLRGKNDYNPSGWEVYFIEDPVNDIPKVDTASQTPNATISNATFTQDELLVLEIWLPVSEQSGMAATDENWLGERVLNLDLQNADRFDNVQAALDELENALEWEIDHADEDGNRSIEPNPYNKGSAPLPSSLDGCISLQEKVESLSDQLFWDEAQRPAAVVVGTGVGLVSIYAAGMAFADMAAFWRSVGGPVTLSVKWILSRFPKSVKSGPFGNGPVIEALPVAKPAGAAAGEGATVAVAVETVASILFMIILKGGGFIQLPPRNCKPSEGITFGCEAMSGDMGPA